MCYNGRSQFSFLCGYILEIFNNHFSRYFKEKAGYFGNDYVICLSTLIY